MMSLCSGIRNDDRNRRQIDAVSKIGASCRTLLLMLATTMGLLEAVTIEATSTTSGLSTTSSSNALTIDTLNLSTTFDQTNVSWISWSSSPPLSNYTSEVAITDSINSTINYAWKASFNVTEKSDVTSPTMSSPFNATAAATIVVTTVTATVETNSTAVSTTASGTSPMTSPTSVFSGLSAATANNQTTVSLVSSASMPTANPTQISANQTTRTMFSNSSQLNSSGSYDVNGTTAAITNYTNYTTVTTSITPPRPSAAVTLTVATATKTGITTTDWSNSWMPAVNETTSIESSSEKPESSITTKELALAIGLGGGGALLIILLVGIAICITKCGRRKNRLTDDTIEKAVNGTGKPSGKNKRKKKKKQKNQQIGVDNIRLTPVIVDQPTHGPSKSKAEQHKPSKRRPKRGSVQQLTLAFAENEQDNQNSQKPTPSNGDAFFPNSDAGSSAALASSSVPVIATAATKLKMNDKGRVRIGAGDAPRSPGGRTVTFAEEPAANTSATTIHGVPSHLMASPATSSLYVKPSTIVFDDDDDQFPPPPPVGFVNPTFSQQFDPPRQQSPRHGQRPVVSGSKLLLTHGSTGESMTDVSDVQENPLFAFVAAE